MKALIHPLTLSAIVLTAYAAYFWSMDMSLYSLQLVWQKL